MEHNFAIFPSVTRLVIKDGRLVKDTEFIGRTEWFMSGFCEFAKINDETLSAMRAGDMITDLMGSGASYYVNQCWGCGKRWLGKTTILIPVFCLDCKRRGVQKSRYQIYDLIVGLQLEQRAVSVLSDDYNDVTVDNLYEFVMIGALGGFDDLKEWAAKL